MLCYVMLYYVMLCLCYVMSSLECSPLRLTLLRPFTFDTYFRLAIHFKLITMYLNI